MEQTELVNEALRALAQRCPRLVRSCFWAGTSAVATEELGHRLSLDLDFHTFEALADVRPLLAEIQCVAERVEARDLVDIHAVLDRRPELVDVARRLVGEQDALLFCDRLLAWSDEEIGRDLRPYPEVDPASACRMRDTLLEWLRAEGGSAR